MLLTFSTEIVRVGCKEESFMVVPKICASNFATAYCRSCHVEISHPTKPAYFCEPSL
jgi:hypothetical protein